MARNDLKERVVGLLERGNTAKDISKAMGEQLSVIKEIEKEYLSARKTKSSPSDKKYINTEKNPQSEDSIEVEKMGIFSKKKSKKEEWDEMQARKRAEDSPPEPPEWVARDQKKKEAKSQIEFGEDVATDDGSEIDDGHTYVSSGKDDDSEDDGDTEPENPAALNPDESSEVNSKLPTIDEMEQALQDEANALQEKYKKLQALKEKLATPQAREAREREEATFVIRTLVGCILELNKGKRLGEEDLRRLDALLRVG